jgi:hypothetical protein
VRSLRLDCYALAVGVAEPEGRLMERHHDPDDPLNGPEHRSGRTCVEKGCNNPAGTAWSPYWCQSCNAARMDHIAQQLGKLLNRTSTPDRGEGAA